MFASVHLQRSWQQVTNPKSEHYLEAVQELIDNRHLLPAPFVVQLDFIGRPVDQRWQAIIEATKPLCKCGKKRIVMPLGRCKPYDLGKAIVLKSSQDICIVPWGGDLRSCVVRISNLSGKGGLKVEWLPFAHGGDERYFDFLYIQDNELLMIDHLSKVTGDNRHPSFDAKLLAPKDNLPLCRVVGVHKHEISLHLHAGVMTPGPNEFHWCP